MDRRTFLQAVGAGLGALGRGGWRPGRAAAEEGQTMKEAASSYVAFGGNGRTFRSLEEARAAGLAPGEVLLLRDLGQVAPPESWAAAEQRGKWRLQAYQLADGTPGRLLRIHDWAGDDGPQAVPAPFTVALGLPGWYALWIGVPSWGGVDVALDGDPAYVPVAAEMGGRQGRSMRATGIEYFRFWKCAELDGRTLSIRVPGGTFSSQPWGLVHGGLSSLRLLRLRDDQAQAYRRDVSDPSTQRVIVVNDGFSHYWAAGDPGKGVDASFVQQYRDSDVKALFFQTPATGAASWPSQVATLLGDGLPEGEWSLLRKGDRRAHDYVRWAVEQGQEGFRVISELCRKGGLQCHASLRMNLFWGDEPFGHFINGSFWREHPELRKPGSPQLDYAQPAARQFVCDLLAELAGNYDVEGVNLDLTRWPPIADPARHDSTVLTGFIAQIRERLNAVAAAKGRKIALSASVVDGYHANATLAEQKIDLEAWLASGALDFLCVEAWDHRAYLATARRYGVPYYAISDNESIKSPRGWQGDPDWAGAHDPLPGEEFLESPPVSSTLDPTEWEQYFLERYRLGVDGVCLHNASGSFIRRLGHVEEMAERIQNNQVWGQEPGLALKLLE